MQEQVYVSLKVKSDVCSEEKNIYGFDQSWKCFEAKAKSIYPYEIKQLTIDQVKKYNCFQSLVLG